MNKKYFFSGMVITLALLFVFASNVAFAGTPTVISAKITGPYTVTVTFSEPVTTNIADYVSFSGSLSSRSITGISGSGTNKISLTFSGTSFGSNASGSMNINPQTSSVSDGSNYNAGTVTVSDGIPPSISSVTLSSNNVNRAFFGSQSVLNLTFNLDESVFSTNITIDGYSVPVGGSGSGPYTASYTMKGTETSPLPIVATFTDYAGNASQMTLSPATTANVNNLLSSVTSDASVSGALKVGDQIRFTLTPSTSQPGATVSGSYNGNYLTWSTSNGGVTFTATYTVQSGDADQSTPLQISGVTLTTSSGLTSVPVSGTDVLKTIDTHGPMLSSSGSMPANVGSSPTFSFITNEAGTIVYYGDCTSSITKASFGQNTIVFDPLPNGTYSNCMIGEKDSGGNLGNLLPIGTFTVSGSSVTSLSNTNTNTTTSDTSSTSCNYYKFYNPLSLGSKGTEVTNLQKRLTNEGYYSGPITGTFGALTQTAVKKYQKAKGLSQLGSVGPGTRSALNSCK